MKDIDKKANNNGGDSDKISNMNVNAGGARQTFSWAFHVKDSGKDYFKAWSQLDMWQQEDIWKLPVLQSVLNK